MSIPGANLLGMASRLIKLDSPKYVQYLRQEKDAAGIISPVYATPVAIQASMQPVGRAMYEKLGLDLNKDYMTAYTRVPLRDLRRGAACDMLQYNGRVWNVESNTDWQNSDGWQGSIICDVGAL